MINYDTFLTFKRNWDLSEVEYTLGECDAMVDCLSIIPLSVEDREKLLGISLVKGAQATTAIEGNTLSEEEIDMINRNIKKLPESERYLEIEVRNILEAMNNLIRSVAYFKEEHIINPNLIKEFHQMIGKDLGEHFQSIPGVYREGEVIVGTYRPPNHQDIPILVEKLCNFLKSEFHFGKGQSFKDSVIESIVAHAYIELIHPFGDGNGRTGRLLEFYILFRGGLPNIASHILSNFYNRTRTEYYMRLNNIQKEENLTNFIKYAVKGFRDGLKEIINTVSNKQLETFWENHIYKTFNEIQYSKKEVMRRKRNLILSIPHGKGLTISEIKNIRVDIASDYARFSDTVLKRDLNELVKMNLLIVTKENKKEYYETNINVLRKSFPLTKSSIISLDN